MKDSYPAISLTRLCRLLGITRQAYYQHFWDVSDITVEHQLVLDHVGQIRKTHPVIGCRKLFFLLQSFLLEHQIKLGRDALFDLLAANKLLVRKRRRRVSTTQSHHWLKKYPNLFIHVWIALLKWILYLRNKSNLLHFVDRYSSITIRLNDSSNICLTSIRCSIFVLF